MPECQNKLWPVHQNRVLTDPEEIKILMDIENFQPKICGAEIPDGAIRCGQCGRKV